ncbi:MAG: hypothetical protein PHP54_03435 [Clostridia bacterium]|nr:hypothetical protein [Clostridia bacterium]
MKITDLSLIFIGVILPLIIVVYINVSFTIKAQEQEIYYQQIIDSAVSDASNEMKQVENEDASIDYGYSGTENKKISVNAQIAVDTFFNSLYNNFDIKGNDAAEKYLQLFVPAVAIIDYDGVQVSSIERYQSGNSEVMQHALKPKRFYSYTYTIVKNPDGNYAMVDGISTSNNAISFHEIDFTMDDYITHRMSNKGLGYNNFNEATNKSFYISDSNNNKELIGVDITAPLLLEEVVNKLTSLRRDIIVNTVVKELSYATNNNNSYARSAGITYSFSFPPTTQEDMYASIENVGLVAFVQGISVGNKYLNTKAFGITRLTLATRYYFTVPTADSKFKMNLYHKDKNCPEYQVSNKEKMTPEYTITKQQAASMVVKCQVDQSGTLLMKQFMGFYACKVCNP